jgi:hypothetical protein
MVKSQPGSGEGFLYEGPGFTDEARWTERVLHWMMG